MPEREGYDCMWDSGRAVFAYSGHVSETGDAVATANVKSASVALTSSLSFTSQMQRGHVSSSIARLRM